MAIRCLPNTLRKFLLSITVSWWKVRLDVASCEGFANTFCIRVKLNIAKHFQYHHLSVGWKDNEKCVRVKKKTCTKPSTFTQHALVLPITLYLLDMYAAQESWMWTILVRDFWVDHPSERFSFNGEMHFPPPHPHCLFQEKKS
jgi:hypothetical protein